MGPSKNQSAGDDLSMHKTSRASNEINVKSWNFIILSRIQGFMYTEYSKWSDDNQAQMKDQLEIW